MHSRSVAIIYNLVDDWNRVEIAAVVDSVADVEQTLQALGHRTTLVRVDGGVREFVHALEALKPDVVVNLCEGYREWTAGESCVAGLLDLMGIPYTGSGPTALAIALNKPLSKELFFARQIPTPRFAVYPSLPPAAPALAFPLILKLASEDASVGITPHNVVFDEPSFLTRLGQLLNEFRSPVLAEEFIDGREFTVAVFDGQAVLVEEIEFQIEPRIVGFKAKWDTESDEFKSTIPQFAPAITDDERRAMMNLAERVYELIGLRDYGRVDFRMDARGGIYVLEANPNPDISVGSGYRRSLAAAGIGFPDFMSRLIDNALQRKTPR
jgi:D-alanine-D-alanine ligase